MEMVQPGARYIDVYLPRKIQRNPDYTFSPMITSSDKDQPAFGSIKIASQDENKILR